MKTIKKTLSEILSEEVSQKPGGRISFLLHKTEISEAMEKGFTVKSIHRIMVRDGKININYSFFTKLVNNHIRHKPEKKKIPYQPPTSKRKFVHSSDSSKWTKTVPEKDRKLDSSEYMNYPTKKKEETPKKKKN